MSKYILAHDLGTSGNKATLYDLQGQLLGSMIQSYPTYYPQDKWVEQDPEDWWAAVCKATKLLIEKTKVCPKDIACVCFSAQMMGCLLIDHKGKPLHKMLIWADSRSEKQEQDMAKKVGGKEGYKIIGHRISASYSAAKLLWIKGNHPEVYAKADKMVQAKDYLIYQLTGKVLTDYSDASGTNLLDINSKKWADTLIDEWDIKKSLLPEIHASTDIAGFVTADAAKQSGLMQGTPVVVGGGDGSCACVGAGVVEPGMIYNVLGTSSWISSASESPLFDDEMRTFNWIHLDQNLYTPCGTMQAAGYSYSWYRDTFCQYEKEKVEKEKNNIYEKIDAMALQSKPGANKLLFLPYLLGERSPHWNLSARGAFIGMNATTDKCDFTRAVLEGVGYNLKIILDSIEKNKPAESLILIGGGAKSRVWAHILSDIWQKKILIPRYIEEATSMGAAVCGGVGIGAYKNFSEIKAMNPIVDSISPDSENNMIYQKMYRAFQLAYKQMCPVYQILQNVSE